MSALALATSSILAYHDTGAGGGGGNMIMLVVFLGVIASAAWLIFSELRWVHTVALTIVGWVAILSVSFVL